MTPLAKSCGSPPYPIELNVSEAEDCDGETEGKWCRKDQRFNSVNVQHEISKNTLI